jgi:hypothetical protein
MSEFEPRLGIRRTNRLAPVSKIPAVQESGTFLDHAVTKLVLQQYLLE